MIAIGIGANSRAGQADISAAIDDMQREANGCDVVAMLGSAAFSGLVEAVVKSRGQAFRAIDLEEMRVRSKDCVTQSARTLDLFGVASVAEAAALVAAGPGSQLVAPRRVAGNVTVAAARSADARGRAQ